MKSEISTPSTNRFDLGFLPIPSRCQQSEENPFVFTNTLNFFFALAATATAANLYYCREPFCGVLVVESNSPPSNPYVFQLSSIYLEPILVEMSEFFNITYKEVTMVPTLLQVGYLTGLVFITPLADLIPRRPLILGSIFLASTFSLGLALCDNFIGFQVLAYAVGICSATPQILNALTADLAPAHKRATAVSIVVSGLVAGMMFARVLSGVITTYSSFKNVFFIAAGTQFLTFALMWAALPDYPKKATGLNYFQILWSMVKLLKSEPLLIQACLIGYCSCAIFVSWWTTLTFLLKEAPYQLSTLHVGLFGLTGTVTITSAAFLGKLNDWVLPWTGTLCGLSLQLATVLVAVFAAKVNVGAVVIVCIFTDVAHQLQQIGNQTRVYSIDSLARGRLNACYMTFVFLGQATGSSAGSHVFLIYGSRSCYLLSLGLLLAAFVFLFLRGPVAGADNRVWFGWSGVYSIRKRVVLDVREERERERNLAIQERRGSEGSIKSVDTLVEKKDSSKKEEEHAAHGVEEIV